MTNLYITADKVGMASGGGRVTKEESEALKELGPCEVWDREELGGEHPSVWGWDGTAKSRLLGYREGKLVRLGGVEFDLVHIYAGCFTDTVRTLKHNKCKVVYTVAAHDVALSKRAHEEIGLQFNYPHLIENDLWYRYCSGYMEADVVVCPSSVAVETVRRQGRQGPIEVIPHGCDIPPEAELVPPPSRFTVGYLGAIGADKGLRWLLEAWRKLNYKDAMLKIAGRDSTSPFMRLLVERYGGGSIHLAGWQDSLSDFYGSISVLVQPSCTEGFGIEVIEAMAHARPVICSVNAGAVDAIRNGCGMACKGFDVETIVGCIDEYRKNPDMVRNHGDSARQVAAKEYNWKTVREQYKSLWSKLSS